MNANKDSYEDAIEELHHFYNNTLRFSCDNWVVNYNHHRSDRNDLHADEVLSILRDTVKKFPVSKSERSFVLHFISDKHLNNAVYNPDKWDRARHAAKSAYFILSGKAHYASFGYSTRIYLDSKMYESLEYVAYKQLCEKYSGFANVNLLDIYLKFDKKHAAYKHEAYKMMAIYSILKNTVKYKTLNIKKHRKVLLSTLKDYLDHFDPNSKDDFAKSLRRDKDKFVPKKRAGVSSNLIIPRMGQFSIQVKLHYINNCLYPLIKSDDTAELSHDQFVALLDCFLKTPGTPKQYAKKAPLTDELIRDCRDTSRTEQEYKSYDN